MKSMFAVVLLAAAVLALPAKSSAPPSAAGIHATAIVPLDNSNSINLDQPVAPAVAPKCAALHESSLLAGTQLVRHYASTAFVGRVRRRHNSRRMDCFIVSSSSRLWQIGERRGDAVMHAADVLLLS